jgi:hypothetical protein
VEDANELQSTRTTFMFAKLITNYALKSSEKHQDRVIFGCFIAVFVLVAVTWNYVSDNYMGDNANRVSVSKLHHNAAMSEALRAANLSLPANVSTLHCWFNWSAGDGDAVSAVCDARLHGRSVADVGSAEDRWREFSDLQSDSKRSLKAVKFDPSDLDSSEFNFAIERGSLGLEVHSNVDAKKLSFAQATSVTNAVVSDFTREEQDRLDRAQRYAPDSIQATWPAASIHSDASH